MQIHWPRRYGWPNAAGWISPIKRGIASHVQLEHADIPQPVGNVVLFHVVDGSTTLNVIIDYDDQMVLHDSADHVDLYFKMQYGRHGYGSATIRPGGYVSPHQALYTYARRWRDLRDSSAPTLDVLGRFGMNWAQTIRGQAIQLLQEQHQFVFQGGGAVVWWGEYMDEIASARVCIDLPGRGEFCYRLIEYLAVGACVVGPELHTEMPVPFRNGVHLVRTPRTLDGLIGWCERLLTDPALRADISRGAEEYFDRYLTREQLGAYYVDACWQRLGD